ncbi:DUF832 [Vombatid gammaherpesvirus 1]|uniref:DUF832 n=1 Tax=Vombatid gammaherpesvirus 1 TaxID=2052651 RepID=A0A3S8D7P5_9GAMA|nr:DUF832 [Vombatid gammaherpesvirus 1]AZB49146.1 DUF832 [Vombatid gammaherpesvirus 1]
MSRVCPGVSNMAKLPIFDVSGIGLTKKKKFVEDFIRHGQLGCVLTAMKGTFGAIENVDFISTLFLLFCQKIQWLREHGRVVQQAANCCEVAINLASGLHSLKDVRPDSMLREAIGKYTDLLKSSCGCTECRALCDHLAKVSPYNRLPKIIPHVHECDVYIKASAIHTAMTLHNWNHLEIAPLDLVPDISLFHGLPASERNTACKLVVLIYLSWVYSIVSYYFVDWISAIRCILKSGCRARKELTSVLESEFLPSTLHSALRSIRCKFPHDVVDCQIPETFDVSMHDFGVASIDSHEVQELITKIGNGSGTLSHSADVEVSSHKSVAHEDQDVEDQGGYIWDDLAVSGASEVSNGQLTDLIQGVSDLQFSVDLDDVNNPEYDYLDLPEFEMELYKKDSETGSDGDVQTVDQVQESTQVEEESLQVDDHGAKGDDLVNFYTRKTI